MQDNRFDLFRRQPFRGVLRDRSCSFLITQEIAQALGRHPGARWSKIDIHVRSDGTPALIGPDGFCDLCGRPDTKGLAHQPYGHGAELSVVVKVVRSGKVSDDDDQEFISDQVFLGDCKVKRVAMVDVSNCPRPLPLPGFEHAPRERKITEVVFRSEIREILKDLPEDIRKYIEKQSILIFSDASSEILSCEGVAWLHRDSILMDRLRELYESLGLAVPDLPEVLRNLYVDTGTEHRNVIGTAEQKHWAISERLGLRLDFRVTPGTMPRANADRNSRTLDELPNGQVLVVDPLPGLSITTPAEKFDACRTACEAALKELDVFLSLPIRGKSKQWYETAVLNRSLRRHVVSAWEKRMDQQLAFARQTLGLLGSK